MVGTQHLNTDSETLFFNKLIAIHSFLSNILKSNVENAYT